MHNKLASARRQPPGVASYDSPVFRSLRIKQIYRYRNGGESIVYLSIFCHPKTKRVLYAASMHNASRDARGYVHVKSHSLPKFIARLARAKKPPGYMRADLFEAAKREGLAFLRRYLPVEHEELHTDTSGYDELAFA